MNQEDKALRSQIEKLEKQNALMRKLSTRQGFYQEYYDLLPKSETYEIAFNQVNDLYFELFGHYRYADHNSFKRMTNYYNKK